MAYTTEEFKRLYDEIEKKYKDECDRLKVEHLQRQRLLLKRYAEENAKYKIGDFVGNVCGIIRIDKIFGKFLAYNNSFDIIYEGLRYKKAKGILTRTKSKDLSQFYASKGVNKIYGEFRAQS